MVWRAYLYETMTGLIGAPIDVPAFSWTRTVGDATLATLKQKGFGEETASSLTIPWKAVPGETMQAKRAAIAPDRTGLLLNWATDFDIDEGRMGTPIVAAAIGMRTDTALDTSFSLTSILGMFEHRYLVREGKYGSGPNGTSPDTIRLTGLSYRAIAAEIGYLCTDAKPSGSLPIDWNYRGEKGTRTREYSAWDIQNNAASQLLENIANVENGPDMQFRPYLTSDGSHVRFEFLAGSDSGIYLGQNRIHALSYDPPGGSVDSLTVDHVGAIHRVYSSGTGTDKAQLTALAEDLTLLGNPNVRWPLVESTYSDSDTDTLSVLKSHAAGVLAANRRPLMQIKASVDANDTDEAGTPHFPLGHVWPGELVKLSIRNYPPLPDGDYATRLMEMSGDQTSRVDLTFDVMEDASI